MKKPDGSTIAVWVSDAVLEDIESPPPSDDGSYIARCESYRSDFEAKASDAFDGGVTSGPIKITS